ncbi:MAG: cupin domain-containing protein [Patescibacteria group bacterium]|jgi:quercetin dioxygenase-like cupin family protein
MLECGHDYYCKQPHKKPKKVADMVTYHEDAVVSREIIKTQNTTVILFAFDKSQGLTEHTTPYDALVQLIEGNAEIIIDRKIYNVKEGEMIIMPANHPHTVNAKEKFKMLLIMAK